MTKTSGVYRCSAVPLLLVLHRSLRRRSWPKLTSATATIASLSLASLPSFAQADNPRGAVLLSGKIHEVLEFSFLLDRVDSQSDSTVASPDCEAGFRFMAVDATGVSSEDSIIDKVDLSSGESHLIQVPFSAIGSGLALIEYSDLRFSGPCRLLVAGRQYDDTSGATRSSGKQSLYFPEQMLKEIQEEASGAAHQEKVLISANKDEHIEISFLLNDSSNAKSIANCEASFRVEARDATGSTQIDYDIDLAAGNHEIISIPVNEFTIGDTIGDTGQVIIEISDVDQFGPCELLDRARLTDEQGNTAASGLPTGKRMHNPFITAKPSG